MTNEEVLARMQRRADELRADAEAWRWLMDHLPEDLDGDGAVEALIVDTLAQVKTLTVDNDRLETEVERLRAENNSKELLIKKMQEVLDTDTERLGKATKWSKWLLAEAKARQSDKAEIESLRALYEVTIEERDAYVQEVGRLRAENVDLTKRVGGLMHEREGLREAAQGALEYFEANSGLNKDVERYHENQLRNALAKEKDEVTTMSAIQNGVEGRWVWYPNDRPAESDPADVVNWNDVRDYAQARGFRIRRV